MANLLKASEVAKRLNISRRQAYYLIANDEIPATRIGPQTVRVDENDLNEYIQKGKSRNAATSG